MCAERRSGAVFFSIDVGQGLSLRKYCGSTGITVQCSVLMAVVSRVLI